MKIEIWSDIACPFCYIGKKNFEKALAEFPHKNQIQIEYRSFELDPYAAKESDQSIHQALAIKYGVSLERAKEMNRLATEKAAAAGIKFDMDRIVPTNFFDAHQLL